MAIVLRSLPVLRAIAHGPATAHDPAKLHHRQLPIDYGYLLYRRQDGGQVTLAPRHCEPPTSEVLSSATPPARFAGGSACRIRSASKRTHSTLGIPVTAEIGSRAQAREHRAIVNTMLCEMKGGFWFAHGQAAHGPATSRGIARPDDDGPRRRRYGTDA